MSSLLETLILVSEKAANIARICRRDQHLFALLIEEKKHDEANPRFVQDFKTLADVLIQETAKYEISKKFPGLRVQGEESNAFCNTLGETIRVEIQGGRDETRELLAKVLNGDDDAANLLSVEVHRDVYLGDVVIVDKGDLDLNRLSIWIDPIDSTAEYINGGTIKDANGIDVTGLGCVTVLIGAYDLETGVPVLGVVNQPFHKNVDDQWKGRYFWGSTPNLSSQQLISESQDPTRAIRKVNSSETPPVTSDESPAATSMESPAATSIESPAATSNEPPPVDESQSAAFSGLYELKNIICISSSESPRVKSKLESCGFRLVEAAGAGYKILAVILGLCDAYVLSKGSTFKWDTCGPQAILRCLGGDVVSYDAALNGEIVSVARYNVEDCENKIDSCCNRGGVIAFRDKDVLLKIMEALK